MGVNPAAYFLLVEGTYFDWGSVFCVFTVTMTLNISKWLSWYVATTSFWNQNALLANVPLWTVPQSPSSKLQIVSTHIFLCGGQVPIHHIWDAYFLCCRLPSFCDPLQIVNSDSGLFPVLFCQACGFLLRKYFITEGDTVQICTPSKPTAHSPAVTGQCDPFSWEGM